VVLESLLELDSFNILLVFYFLLDVLVPLQKFVVLCFSQLKSLIKIGLKLLLERIHFILLLLNELGLSGNNFLRSFLHVLLSFLGLELLASNLDLMSLLISN